MQQFVERDGTYVEIRADHDFGAVTLRKVFTGAHHATNASLWAVQACKCQKDTADAAEPRDADIHHFSAMHVPILVEVSG